MKNLHLRKIFLAFSCLLLAALTLVGMGWFTNMGRSLKAVASFEPVANSTHPEAQPAASLDARVTLTMSVGLVPNECTQKSAETVPANKLVFLCYIIYNAGDVPLTSYTLTHAPPLLSDSGGLALAPGTETTRILGTVFTNTTNLNATLVASANVSGTEVNVSATGSVSVTVLRPNVTLGYNLSGSPNQCGVPTLSFASGDTLYHCIVIRNVGPVAVTQQTLSIPILGISNIDLNLNLNPGQVVTLTESNRPNLPIPLVQQGVLTGFSSRATLVAKTADSDVITATATANGVVGTVRTSTTVNAGTDANTCATQHTGVMSSGAIVYFCVRITNSGTTTITDHSLLVPELGIDVAFQAPLSPNQTLTLHSRPLSNTVTLAALGPHTLTNSFVLVFVYKPGRDQEAGSSESVPVNVAVATPIPTRTITPTVTSTPVPPASDTPLFTPTPSDTPPPTIPPTPTETPSLTPSATVPPPTPTRSFAISSLATPTPIIPTPDVIATNNAIAAQQATANAQAAIVQADQIATSYAIQTEQAVIATNAAVALLTPAAAFIDPNATPTLDPNVTVSLPLAANEGLMPVVATEIVPPTITPIAGPLLEAQVVITITATPNPALRPIAPGAPPPPPTDLLSIFGQSVERVLVVASWIWFLLAGLVFLAVTTIFFGLTLRRNPEERFDLYELASEESDAPESRPASRSPSPARRRSSSDDAWPDSLP